MDGGVAGTGPANLQDSLPRSDVAAGSRASASVHIAAAGLIQDQIEASLLSLVSPQVGQLLERMEQSRLTLDPRLLDGLVQRVAAAANSRDMPGAVAAIAELIALDPERGGQLVREAASLAPIRGQVDDLLQRLEVGAKGDAERTLAAASLAIQTGARTSEAASFHPQVLDVAQRFLDAGQHINFVRAAELGQAILAYVPATAIDINAPGYRGKRASGQDPRLAQERPRTLWWRVPVLLMALGLLILVVFGFILSRR